MSPEGVCLFIYTVLSSPCVVPTLTWTRNKCIFVIPWAVKAVTVGKAPPPFLTAHYTGVGWMFTMVRVRVLYCTVTAVSPWGAKARAQAVIGCSALLSWTDCSVAVPYLTLYCSVADSAVITIMVTPAYVTECTVRKRVSKLVSKSIWQYPPRFDNSLLNSGVPLALSQDSQNKHSIWNCFFFYYYFL